MLIIHRGDPGPGSRTDPLLQARSSQASLPRSGCNCPRHRLGVVWSWRSTWAGDSTSNRKGEVFCGKKKKVWPTNMGGCWYAHICKNPLRIRIVIYDHWQRCSVRTYCGLVYPGWLLGSPAYKMSFLKIVWETSACSLMWMPISGNELWSYVLTYHINIIYIIIYNNPILSQYIPTMATSWCSDNQNHQQVHRKSLGWWSTCKQ